MNVLEPQTSSASGLKLASSTDQWARKTSKMWIATCKLRKSEAYGDIFLTVIRILPNWRSEGKGGDAGRDESRCGDVGSQDGGAGYETCRLKRNVMAVVVFWRRL